MLAQRALASLVRTRGIFDVLLYSAEVSVEGSFFPPGGIPFPVPAEQLQWERAAIALPLARGRELPEAIEVGERLLDLQPGPFEGYVSAPLAFAGAPNEEVSFAFAAKLQGSGALLFRPAPKSTSVEVEANWPHPKFVGVLASSHDIGAGGFTARWQLRSAGAAFFSRWEDREENETKREKAFGVELLQPVDSYRMTRRSIKYEFLFTALTLGVFLVIEIFGARRIHPIQYLMVGGALVLFYLLLLSLAEHIGFGAAYGASSLAVVALVAGYAVSALESGLQGATVGGVLVTLYGFLYVLLALQDFSLLVGSIGIFSILAAIMLGSRHVDWYGLGKAGK